MKALILSKLFAVPLPLEPLANSESMFCMFPIPKVSEKNGQPVRVSLGKK